jgi:hypothetical protein
VGTILGIAQGDNFGVTPLYKPFKGGEGGGEQEGNHAKVLRQGGCQKLESDQFVWKQRRGTKVAIVIINNFQNGVDAYVRPT